MGKLAKMKKIPFFIYIYTGGAGRSLHTKKKFCFSKNTFFLKFLFTVSSCSLSDFKSKRNFKIGHQRARQNFFSCFRNFHF